MGRSSSKSRRKGIKREKANRGIPVFAALLVVFIAAATLLVLYLTKHENARQWFETTVRREEPVDPELLALRVQQGALSALAGLGVDEDQLSVEGGDADGVSSGPRLWEAPLPPGVSLERANLAVTRAVEGAEGRILDGFEWRAKRTKRRCLTLIAAVDSVPCLELRLTESAQSKAGDAAAKAKLAIVIVEMGRELDAAARGLIESPLALTLAVLPAHPASEETARLACARGKEVLLDLPMEPAGYPRKDPGEGAVLLDHSAREIRKRVRGHLKDLGCGAGVVNYMGSAFMRDRDLMRAVLEEIGKERLFFLDSSAAAQSAVLETAEAIGVPCLAGDFSLEAGGEGPEGLAKEMDRVERLALQRGRALVIAKPSKGLLELLTSRAGGYDSKGIILVNASVLLEDG